MSTHIKCVEKSINCLRKKIKRNNFLILCSFLYFIGIQTERFMIAEMIAFLRLCGLLTTHPDFKSIDLYPRRLKSGINFALEPEWAYTWVGLYLRFYCKLRTSK